MNSRTILTVLAGLALLMQSSVASAVYLNLNTQANSIADLGTALSITDPASGALGTVTLDPNRFSSTATATLNGAPVVSDAQVAPNVAYAQSALYDLNHQSAATGQVMDINPNADLTLIGTNAGWGKATASYTQYFTVTGNGTVQYDGWYSIFKDVVDLTGVSVPVHARWDVLFRLVNTRTGLSTALGDSEDYFIDAFSSGRPSGDSMLSLFLPGFVSGDTGYVYAFASTEVVPEPGTFLLVGAGLTGLALYRRKRMTSQG